MAAAHLDLPKQRDGESVRDFANRINFIFREKCGKYNSTANARRFRRNTKKSWLKTGIKQEILRFVWPDMLKDDDNIIWADMVAALQDAEWLYYLWNPKPLPEGVAKDNPCNFNVDNNGYVKVYTDGACSNNGKSYPKAGIGVWFGPNHELNVSQPLRWGLPVTNNVADFAAIIRAVTMVKEKGMRRLVIYSNSHYLNASIKGYVKNWFCNGWELLNGEPVKHKKLFRKYFRITEDMSVRLRFVHKKKKVKGNVEADKLAKEGAKRYRYP